MKRHTTSITTSNPTKFVVDRKAPVRQATGMLLSLAMLACSAVMPAQAQQAQEVGSGATAPSAGPTDWVGVAVSTNGRVFLQPNGTSEMRTRFEVRSECENTVGRTCHAIAVPSHWDVIALSCRGRGRIGGYVGGSGMGNAYSIAYDRASQAGFNPGECSEVYRY